MWFQPILLKICVKSQEKIDQLIQVQLLSIKYLYSDSQIM